MEWSLLVEDSQPDKMDSLMSLALEKLLLFLLVDHPAHARKQHVLMGRQTVMEDVYVMRDTVALTVRVILPLSSAVPRGSHW